VRKAPHDTPPARSDTPKSQRVHAPAIRLSPAAGTYGNVFDGFEVTDSLPIPRRTGVFAAMENNSKLEKSSNEVEDVKDDRPIDPASKRFDLLASRLTL
jgi:hypothetical protein